MLLDINEKPKYFTTSTFIQLKYMVFKASLLADDKRANKEMIIDVSVLEFPKSWVSRGHFPKRLKHLDFTRCPHCLRHFILKRGQVACSRACQASTLLNKHALLHQANWSRFEMLVFCTSCGQALNFMSNKKWDKCDKVCLRCYNIKRKVA